MDDILALGENGQPIYTSALQIREALRLKKQQHIVDCLAIPQINEQGNRIDWYAPFEGKVTSWIAASSTERKAAVKQLAICLASASDISLRAKKSEKAAQQLFGALLAKALQFPDQNHVYLVSGKPVITFWGFVSQDKKMRSDPLDCLRQSTDVVESAIKVESIVKAESTVVPPEIRAKTVVTPAAVELSPQADIIPTPQLVAEPEVTVGSEPIKTPVRWLRIGGVLSIAALIGALVAQFSGNLPGSTAPTAETQSSTAEHMTEQLEPSASHKPQVTADALAPVEPITASVPPPIMQPLLPLDHAPVPPDAKVAAESIVAEPMAVEPIAAEPVTPPVTRANNNALILPANAVKIGSTAFLNGNWRAIPEIKSSLTGKPPSLRYQIKQGKGSVKITHGDNVTCRANVTAGLMKSGNLVINSRYRAQCSDGSKYQIPEIVCKQGTTDIADCKGRYDANTTLSMTMTRESK
ncbi:virulence factor [Yersinia pestis subsp. microtus bv. Altaica]|uniref:Virulence factor n=2 Tax=Yersinia pestis TaxID=632 RepID=A0A384KQ99_YERPE|nr:SrfA family protein [Yersinia pestis]EDM42285.1 putative virulence factor [Yersinia pestis CA88-4125]EIQ90100.1 myosin light chain kinase, smooth muscle [Yersinia pestis PY-03]EIR01566.1 myosin light chain kinase, smooth muscle [Yersinia pestis PY-04]EIR06164.1 myosin light chain kinase, smooth muscle [Yersinia pestis PY-06]EIR17978.1 myosin light chain kinase, smooth muscle [Yersinia pestis PY-08]EIR19966.1 myosin light chain kinase, smooth muscle [Yersinia pestis PY-09]EIR33038.1 myosin